jgi:hypothetical protein
MPELQTSSVDQLEHGIRAVFVAGSGAMTLTVIGQTSAASLVAAVMEGDATARISRSAADRRLRQIQRRSRAMAMPCALCANTLWRGAAPHAVGILRPYDVDLAPVAIGMAICASCGEDRSEAELGMAAVTKLRAEWMPGLRTFLPTPEVGHA